MSRFIVELGEHLAAEKPRDSPSEADQGPLKRGRLRRVLGISGIVLAVLLAAAGIGGYFYWQGLKKTPQYSLALMIDAARRDDQQQMDEVIDIDSVVDDFLPQITGKAVELYGRGLPPQVITRISALAAPVLPAVKDRARLELPGVIRERTEKFEKIPFWAIAAGAGRYLDVRIEGDTAYVKSLIPERPLEVRMRRKGDRWQIVGVVDDALATKIAQKIGQNIIALATKGFGGSDEKSLGIRNLQELLNQAQEILP